jgi:hypothetical protein
MVHTKTVVGTTREVINNKSKAKQQMRSQPELHGKFLVMTDTFFRTQIRPFAHLSHTLRLLHIVYQSLSMAQHRELWTIFSLHSHTRTTTRVKVLTKTLSDLSHTAPSCYFVPRCQCQEFNLPSVKNHLLKFHTIAFNNKQVTQIIGCSMIKRTLCMFLCIKKTSQRETACHPHNTRR